MEATRGDAAATTWIFRGDNKSRRRRGHDLNIPRGRVAAATTWIFRGDESTTRKRGRNRSNARRYRRAAAALSALSSDTDAADERLQTLLDRFRQKVPGTSYEVSDGFCTGVPREDGAVSLWAVADVDGCVVVVDCGGEAPHAGSVLALAEGAAENPEAVVDALKRAMAGAGPEHRCLAGPPRRPRSIEFHAELSDARDAFAGLAEKLEVATTLAKAGPKRSGFKAAKCLRGASQLAFAAGDAQGGNQTARCLQDAVSLPRVERLCVPEHLSEMLANFESGLTRGWLPHRRRDRRRRFGLKSAAQRPQGRRGPLPAREGPLRGAAQGGQRPGRGVPRAQGRASLHRRLEEGGAPTAPPLSRNSPRLVTPRFLPP